MIALLDDLPLVRMGDGSVMAYDERWLRRCLDRAADGAGVADWWQAEAVTRSISEFLRLDFVEPCVEIAELEETIKGVLSGIGFSEIAGQFRPLPPPAHISLAQIAAQAGEGFELFFFDLLDRKIRALRREGAVQVDCDGLRECVKTLRRAKSWCRDCSELRQEIVEFIRKQFSGRLPHELCSHPAHLVEIQLE